MYDLRTTTLTRPQHPLDFRVLPHGRLRSSVPPRCTSRMRSTQQRTVRTTPSVSSARALGSALPSSSTSATDPQTAGA